LNPRTGDAAHEAPRIIALPVFRNERGTLCVAEFSQHIGFSPRRFYFMTDVPAGTVRGVHGHKRLRQCMLCLKGAVTVDLETRGERFSFRLDRPDQALLVPPGCWRVVRDFQSDTVVGVLASQEYDESDYLSEYADFRAWESETAASAEIPYLDLARSSAATEGEIDGAIARVVRSGRYIGGPEVEAFERAFAGYCGVDHAVGVGNGLDALTIALEARDIGRGDTVLVPANTFIATALAVSRVGAEPIFVDVEADTANIDPQATAAAVRPDTRAIIPVHLYGHPADMDPLRVLADRHGLFLLEDAAQAHGARYRGRPCGSLGDAAAFSFYPTKNLGALGDAGALISNDPELVRRARAFANYGAEQKDHHVLKGVNSRLDPLQAAVLAVKLRHLDGWNERRRALAARYAAGLGDLDGLALPAVRPWALPVWYVFCVRVSGGRRDPLRHHLAASGIGSNLHYPTPIHLQPAYRELGLSQGAFPVAERLAREIVSLPLDPFHADAEIDCVIDCIRAFFRAE
jgi:dTDP-3-amino-3,4,6-trideoxy-alpha-D-glucose transaminase